MVGVLPVVKPRQRKLPPGGIRPALHRVEIPPFVHHQHDVGSVVIGETLAVEITHEVLGQRAKRVIRRGANAHHQHPAGGGLIWSCAVHRQLKQIRTLPGVLSMRALARPKGAGKLPRQQVMGGIEVNLLPTGQRHHPALARAMPNHFRVAEIFKPRRWQNRIPLVTLPAAAPVAAIRQALGLLVILWVIGEHLMAGVKRHEPRLALEQPRHIVLIDHGTTRKAGAVFVGRQRNGQMLPVAQVTADRMPPVHWPPDGTERVELIKQMVLAFKKH